MRVNAQRCFVKKVFLEISQNAHDLFRKMPESLSRNSQGNSEGLSPATLLKKRPWHRCFPVDFVKFLRTPSFTEHLCWLLSRFAEVTVD